LIVEVEFCWFGFFRICWFFFNECAWLWKKNWFFC